jgi:hypothetical protein
VRAAAAGVAIAAAGLPAIPTLRWKEPLPRTIRLAADSRGYAVKLEAHCEVGVSGFEVRMAGRTAFMAGEEVDATRRVLNVRLGASRESPVHFRWRAVSSRGVLSRALHISVEWPRGLRNGLG